MANIILPCMPECDIYAVRSEPGSAPKILQTQLKKKGSGSLGKQDMAVARLVNDE